MHKLILLILLLSSISCTMLYTYLHPRQPFCIYQELPAEILLKIQMNNTQPVQLLIHRQSSLLLAQSNLISKTILYTPHQSGDYKICWVHNNNEHTHLGFQFSIGLKANDFQSTLDQDSHTQLIDIAEHGSILSQIIVNTTKYFNHVLHEKQSKHLGVGSTTLLLSISFVLISGILLFIQYKVVRASIREKKFN